MECTLRNNYPFAIDNHSICSLLDKDVCAVKKNRLQESNMNFLIGIRNTKYTRCPVAWLGEAKGSCILRHRGVQLILAYSWVRPAILAAGKGGGGMFFFYFFCHRGVQLILAYSWVRPAVLAAGKGSGGMFFISSVTEASN